MTANRRIVMNIWSIFYISTALLFIVLAVLNGALKNTEMIKYSIAVRRITLAFTLIVLDAVLIFNLSSLGEAEYVLNQRNFIESLSVIIVYTSILFNIIEAIIDKTKSTLFEKK